MARVLARAYALRKTFNFPSSSPTCSLPLLFLRLHPLDALTNQPSVSQRLLYSTSILERFNFKASVSSTSVEKGEEGTTVENKEGNGSTNTEGAASEQKEESGCSSDSKTKSDSAKRPRRGTRRIAFSDSDSEGDLDDLSKNDLMKLVTDKETLLKAKQKEIAAIEDKLLRSYAEIENVMDRTKREAENSKKFAIQNFAKSLLDVADNLGRASSVVKESFSKIDVSQDASRSVPLLKTLLEGVDMTEKQLIVAFRKFGVEKYDPMNEQFDPNRHNAAFQVPDNSKPVGTAALWEDKIGRTLPRVTVTEDHLLAIAAEMCIPRSIVASFTHDIFIKGCQVDFDIEGHNEVEILDLYPDETYQTVDECFQEFAVKMNQGEETQSNEKTKMEILPIQALMVNQ